MRFSNALPLLALSGVTAFQTRTRTPLAVTNINSRDVVSSSSALMSSTMENTDLVNGVNGMRRKKTKKVSFPFFLRVIVQLSVF